MIIKYKPPVSLKLKKTKLLKLKISGNESFDPYGTISAGDFKIMTAEAIVKYKKGVLKKNQLKVTVVIPAGTAPQTIPIRVGNCFGEIVIL